MRRENDYYNDGLDPSEEYYIKRKKGNDEETYFRPKESLPPHLLRAKKVKSKYKV